MADKTEVQLKQDNNTSFPNNNTGFITPDKLRNFNVDVIDTLFAEDGKLRTQIENVATSGSGVGIIEEGTLLGTATGLNFTGSFTVTFSGSTATIDTDFIGGIEFNDYTQSTDLRLDSLESATGSYATTASLNSVSSSLASDISSNGIRITSLELVTGSFATTSSLNSVSSSLASDITINSNNISSNDTDISNLQADSASFETRVTTNENNISTNTSDISDVSSSFESRITTNSDDIANNTSTITSNSASFEARISTNETDIASLEAETGSYATSTELDNVSSSLASDITINSDKIIGNADSITDNASSISALNSETGSYATSVELTNVSSSLAARDTINEDSISSNETRIGSLEAATGSYATSTELNNVSSSFESRLTTDESNIQANTDAINNIDTGSFIDSGSFNAYTSSVDGRITTNENDIATLTGETGSYATSTEVDNVSSSLATDISTNADNIGSNDTDISNLQADSASFEGRITTNQDSITSNENSIISLEAETGSYATTGSNTFVGNQEIQGALTASLQQGYAWVGGIGDITEATPTSSFGGGTGVGFPFTGSAQITGSLGVTGSITQVRSDGTNGSVITNAGDLWSSSEKVEKVVTLTQAEYDALGSTDSGVLYVISDQYITGSNLPSSFTGSLKVSGSFELDGPLTASLTEGNVWVGGNGDVTEEIPTSSLSVASASYAETSSYADSASFADSADSSSFAVTASYAENAGGGAGFPYTGDAQISGSLGVTGSISQVLSDGTSGSVISNAGDIWPSSDKVEKVVTLTQAEYDAIGVYDDSTLYVISGSVSTYLTPEYTGSFNVSGSVNIDGNATGNVRSVAIASSTASFDLQSSAYFTSSINNTTHYEFTNLTAGITAQIDLNTIGSTPTIDFGSNVLQPSGSGYTPSAAGGRDILTVTCIDGTNVMLIAANNFE